MSDPAVADEPKSPSDPKNYTERVTVKKWNRDKFLKPISDQPAFWGEIGGQMVIYTKPVAANVQTPKGSEITDKDGNVYVVEKVTEGILYHTNYVKLKTKGK